MNKLTSVHTQIPYDYYSLKFCRPRGGIKRATENLGEFLGGDLIENSPFQLFMEQDQFCKVLCQVDLAKSDVSALKTIIKEEYHNNWIIDNLPAASIVDSEQYIITAYAGGFPVGYQDHKASYLFNHVNIIVEYHPLDDGSRVVGFYVEPFTVKHRAGQESEIPNFKGSYLGRFPLVSADFWTSDHLSERSRRVDVFLLTRARGTLTLKRR